MCDSIHSSAPAMTNKLYQCQEQQTWGRTAAARSKKGLELKSGCKTLPALPREEGKCSQGEGCHRKRKPKVFPALVPSFSFSPGEKLTLFPWGMMCKPIKGHWTPHPSATSEQTKPLLCLCSFCPGAEELMSSIINFMFEFFSNQPTRTVSNDCMSKCRGEELHCGVCCRLHFPGNND